MSTGPLTSNSQVFRQTSNAQQALSNEVREKIEENLPATENETRPEGNIDTQDDVQNIRQRQTPPPEQDFDPENGFQMPDIRDSVGNILENGLEIMANDPRLQGLIFNHGGEEFLTNIVNDIDNIENATVNYDQSSETLTINGEYNTQIPLIPNLDFTVVLDAPKLEDGQVIIGIQDISVPGIDALGMGEFTDEVLIERMLESMNQRLSEFGLEAQYDEENNQFVIPVLGH